MANIQAQAPDDIQDRASAVIQSSGLSVSDVVLLFMTRIAADQVLPLDLFPPGAETLHALAEAQTGKLVPGTIDASWPI